MKITVNNIPLELHNGARVKDAILKYYSQNGKNIPKPFPPVEDRFGNTVDYDGELTDGNTLIIKEKHKKSIFSPNAGSCLACIHVSFLLQHWWKNNNKQRR